MQANFIVIGAAFQSGCIPISGESIEKAIKMNGVAVSQNTNAYETVSHIINKIQIVNFYKNEGSLESFNRIENIEELVNGINDFIEGQEELFESDKSLSKYLEDVALYSETDKEVSNERVSLMTVHMAKGLEFPIVYVIGMEENLFPSVMSINSREEVEEERRLLYVAMTRA